MADELDTRVRSLEAERLRPVPPAQPSGGGAPLAEVLELLREITADDQGDEH